MHDGDSLWAVALARGKPVEVGCATQRELWYPSLFCGHVREVAAAQGHPRMSSASDQTILRVLEEARARPFRLRYYRARKDPGLDPSSTAA